MKRFLPVAVCLCLCAAASAQYLAHRRVAFRTVAAAGGNGLLTGLVAVWEMEAADVTTQEDATAANLDGTVVGTTIRTNTHIQGTYGGTAPGSAFWRNTDAIFKGTGSFTLAAWVNADNLTHAGQIIGGRDNIDNVWNLSTTTGNNFYFWITGSARQNVTNTVTAFTGTGWHLVVAAYNSTNQTGYISVDGSTFDASTAIDALVNNSSYFYWGNGDYLTDETAFWSRVLTQTQVNTLWASGSGFFYSGGGWD